jgi:hypothetical protein
LVNSAWTGKVPGILLIMENGHKDIKYLNRLQKALKVYPGLKNIKI